LENRVIINIEVAVVDDDDRYLMIVRGPGEEHAAGALSFPGGKLDFDERADILEATAIREVQEEVGITISDPRYVESHSFRITGADVVDIVFLARFAGGEPVIADPDEVAALRWMTPDELRHDPATPPWTLDALARVEAYRNSFPR
jgi:8-oxo-dGTP diphosphatase